MALDYTQENAAVESPDVANELKKIDIEIRLKEPRHNEVEALEFAISELRQDINKKSC